MTRYWLVLAPAVLSSVFYAWAFSGFVIDDAYITFAYSRNFAESGQLLLRPGNFVEANSSFLWSLLLGALSRAAGDPLLWSKLIGPVAHAGCVVIVAAMLVRREMTAERRFLIAAAAALPFGFGLWANFGMENGLTALLCFAAVATAPREGRFADLVLLPALMVCIYTVRPEGFGYVFVIYALEFARRAWLGKSMRRLALGLIPAAAAIAGYEVFGWAYYGAWLPNSATAKVDRDLVERIVAGLDYTFASSHVLVAWMVPVALAVGAFDIFRRRFDPADRRDAAVLIGLGLTAAVFGFVTLYGFDWMPAGRFYAMVLPFSAGFIALRLMELPLLRGRAARLGALGLFALSQAGAAAVWGPRLVDLQKSEDLALAAMVDDLNRAAAAEDVLALSDIGIAAYAYKGPIFDWWGLGSRLVAERGEAIGRITPETVMEADPEFLVIYANKADGPNIDQPLEGMAWRSSALAKDPALMERYCRLTAYRFWEGRHLVLLARRDVFERPGFAAAAPERWEIGRCASPVRTAG